MKDTKIKQLIKDSVIKLLNNTTAELKIEKIICKQEAKTHFIPIRYRIFGGLLQSLNIQFGNFIEVLLHKIVETEKTLRLLLRYPARKMYLLL